MGMRDYEGLKPGLYLQCGDQFTALKTRDGYSHSVTWDQFVRDAGGRRGGYGGNVESLAAEVAWVYVAMNKRKAQILEIPYRWERNGVEMEGETPFNLLTSELLQQTDEGLQFYATAYWLKQRAGNRMIGGRWLDPTTIEVDYQSATVADGIQWYKRELDSGRVVSIPASDVVRFIIPGQRELRPGTATGEATSLAAAILRGVDQTDRTFYANNGLPIMLVRVPAATADQERTKLETAFRRLFNRGGGTQSIRVQAVGADVTVEPLSFKPADMNADVLTDKQIDAILAAHDVPKSIALSNAANYATDIAASRRFIGAMGARLTYIAEVINADKDFKAAGYAMVVRVEDHTAMKEDEAQRASAFGSYVTGGFEPEAAAYLVGISIDDFPDGIVPFKEPEPVPAALAPFAGQNNAPGQNPVDDRDQEAVEAEGKSFRNWLRKRDNPDPDEFQNYHLTDAEKDEIYWRVKSYSGQTTTDNLTAQFADMMARFDSVLVGGEETGEDGS